MKIKVYIKKNANAILDETLKQVNHTRVVFKYCSVTHLIIKTGSANSMFLNVMKVKREGCCKV